ncbi:hypothetical protein C815_01938 [Firmicutes bacterium M10-2]|nr:hypothetical protein C815_01938 [Firmicutes bacterium M10-2]
MKEEKQISDLVTKYCETIATQNINEFASLWSEQKENMLISLTTLYIGTKAICDDFLIGAIHQAYETIELIADDIQIRMIEKDVAIVVFKYHTECICRKTKEPYGICGLETQVVVKENGQWKFVQIHYSK